MVAYDCNATNEFLLSMGGAAWESAEYFQEPWSEQCFSLTQPGHSSSKY